MRHLHISFKELEDKILKHWLKHLIARGILQVEKEIEMLLKIKKPFNGINSPWIEMTLAITMALVKFPFTPSWQYRPEFIPKASCNGSSSNQEK